MPFLFENLCFHALFFVVPGVLAGAMAQNGRLPSRRPKFTFLKGEGNGGRAQEYTGVKSTSEGFLQTVLFLGEETLRARAHT